MSDQEPPVHEHLGDGAYVTFTGYSLEVKANHHETPTDVVCLDERAVRNLVRFAQRVGMFPRSICEGSEG